MTSPESRAGESIGAFDPVRGTPTQHRHALLAKRVALGCFLAAYLWMVWAVVTHGYEETPEWYLNSTRAWDRNARLDHWQFEGFDLLAPSAALISLAAVIFWGFAFYEVPRNVRALLTRFAGFVGLFVGALCVLISSDLLWRLVH
ncbi:MAG: hypothetical protein AAF196_10035 [Planctomycetota bacterium]